MLYTTAATEDVVLLEYNTPGVLYYMTQGSRLAASDGESGPGPVASMDTAAASRAPWAPSQ